MPAPERGASLSQRGLVRRRQAEHGAGHRWRGVEFRFQRAEPHGDLLALLRLWNLRGERQLFEGRTREAQRTYVRLEQTALQMGLVEPCIVPWARSAIHAHLACSAIADGERIVAHLDKVSEILPCRWPRLAAALGRLQVAERRGDTRRAERALTIRSSRWEKAARMRASPRNGSGRPC